MLWIYCIPLIVVRCPSMLGSHEGAQIPHCILIHVTIELNFYLDLIVCLRWADEEHLPRNVWRFAWSVAVVCKVLIAVWRLASPPADPFSQRSVRVEQKDCNHYWSITMSPKNGLILYHGRCAGWWMSNNTTIKTKAGRNLYNGQKNKTHWQIISMWWNIMS